MCFSVRAAGASSLRVLWITSIGHFTRAGSVTARVEACAHGQPAAQDTASGGKSKRKHWMPGFPNSGLPAEMTHRAGSLWEGPLGILAQPRNGTNYSISFPFRLNTVTRKKNILEVGIIFSWSVMKKKKKLANKRKKIQSQGGFRLGWAQGSFSCSSASEMFLKRASSKSSSTLPVQQKAWPPLLLLLPWH